MDIESFTMVIFGGTGDLTQRRLLPALFHLFQDREFPEAFSILCFARSDLDEGQYRALMREAVYRFHEGSYDETQWSNFSRHLFYVRGEYDEAEAYGRLCRKIEEIEASSEHPKNVIYYMAVPPDKMPVVVDQLKNQHLCRERFASKIVVEKPFGRDRESAARLNRLLRDAFEERQIYRIDHYLAKETVQNIAFFRFSNSIFEQIWNRHYIDNVQITVAEAIGIEHRGPFYEQSGVVRDIVQNHLVQLIALVAMEPPIGFEADFIRNEKLKVFLSMTPLQGRAIDRFTVRGQYGPGTIEGKDVRGYREEEGVSSDSNTPTFFAARFHISNWRWTGVPFYVRAGKRMARQVTEIVIEFKCPPLSLFGDAAGLLGANLLFLTIQPEERIALQFNVKYPYSFKKVHSTKMVLDYQETFQIRYHPAYERLLLDCLKGDLTLFVREDSIEAMWAIVDPIIKRWEEVPAHTFPNYAAGTWGPKEADLLLRRDGRHWNTS